MNRREDDAPCERVRSFLKVSARLTARCIRVAPEVFILGWITVETTCAETDHVTLYF